MYARCCDTAMFLDFTKGHWLTVYRGRLPDDIPRATMRMMTAERPEGVTLPDDMTNTPGRSGKFMLKLLRAWIAMGFRRPSMACHDRRARRTVHKARSPRSADVGGPWGAHVYRFRRPLLKRVIV